MKEIRNKIMLIIGLILCIVIGIIYYQNHQFEYLINGEAKEELDLKHEFGEALDLSVESLQLTTNKDDKIFVNIPEISEIKTYEIVYYVENETKTFTLHLEVTDTTAPEISGELSYQVTQGDSFDCSNLNLTARDNYDQDLTNQLMMNEVDTSEVGTQELEVSVKDSHNNEAKVTIQLEVKQKKVNVPDSSGKNIVSNPNDITVLINKKNYLPDGWEPSDLVLVNTSGQNHYLRSEAAQQWNQLYQQAQNDGVSIHLVSSYRTQSYQRNLYNQYMASDPENAPYYSAYPRTSEHELGLAIDVSYDWSLHDDLQNSSVGIWMNSYGWKYGWIMRYPQGKSDITGYIFEAWHYRYVGVELATQLHNQGITLEEYYR